MVEYFSLCIVSIADNEQTQNIQHDYVFTLAGFCQYTNRRVLSSQTVSMSSASPFDKSAFRLMHFLLFHSVFSHFTFPFRFWAFGWQRKKSESKTQIHTFGWNSVEQCLQRKCTSFCVHRCMKNDFFVRSQDDGDNNNDKDGTNGK